MRAAAALAALLLAASPAVARMHAGPSQLHAGHRLQGAIAPLDGGGAFATPAAAYSLRKLKSTYAGPGIKLRRASDNATQDINFLGFTGFTGAPLNVAAAQTFCNATTCFIDTWYDQSGNGRNVFSAPANQPDFIFNCLGAQPCARSDASSDQLLSASVAWAAGKSSLSGVGRRTLGTGGCIFAGKGINWLMGGGTAATWTVFDNATGSINAVAADNAWHAGIGIIDGASSLVRIDATETAGSLSGSASAATVYVAYGGAVGTTCDYDEALLWDNYALTPSERAALTANQRAYWGF